MKEIMDRVYTPDEILKLFNETNLDEEFKAIVNQRMNALLQFMVNVSVKPEKTMVLTQAHGDYWVEEHNRFVMLYQRYYD